MKMVTTYEDVKDVLYVIQLSLPIYKTRLVSWVINSFFWRILHNLNFHNYTIMTVQKLKPQDFTRISYFENRMKRMW